MIYDIYVQDNVHLGVNTCLGCGPSNRKSFCAEVNSFPCHEINHVVTFQCRRWRPRCRMQHVGQGPDWPPSGYLEWSVWGWGWGGV